MKEEWRPVEGFPYKVSNFGRVKRIGKARGAVVGQILKPRLRQGYPRVALSPGPVEKCVHTLVAEAFIGPCPAGYMCNHIDANRANNQVSNLEWVTRKENAEHAARLGLYADVRGENNPRAKLTRAQAVLIKESADTAPVLAEQFGVSRSLITAIRRNECWK